jgi:hypothetical protein
LVGSDYECGRREQPLDSGGAGSRTGGETRQLEQLDEALLFRPADRFSADQLDVTDRVDEHLKPPAAISFDFKHSSLFERLKTVYARFAPVSSILFNIQHFFSTHKMGV